MGKPRNRWIVVEAKFSQESFAARNMRQQGFTVYAPLFRERRSEGVRKVSHLFAPYIFVQLKHRQSWHPISGTRGVKRVVLSLTKIENNKSGEPSPSVIQSAHVELIRSLECPKSGYVILADEEPPVFDLRDSVTPTAGAFAGQTGLYFGKTSASRCKVLFEMLGKTVVSEIMTKDLAHAA